MIISFSTDNVPPGGRLEHYRRMVARRWSRFQVDCNSISEEAFKARLTTGSVSHARFFELETNDHDVYHPAALSGARRSARIVLQRSATSRFSQGSGSMLLRPGDLLVIDSVKEMQAVLRGSVGLSVLEIPTSAAPQELSFLLHMSGRRIDGTSGAGRVASSFLTSFLDNADRFPEPVGRRLLHSLIDVLNTAALELDGIETSGSSAHPKVSRHQAFHIHRLKIFLDDQLRDPDLTPATIAAANGISRRYLSKLFEIEGTSVTRYIWERRLKRSRRDLEDPVARSRSITEIAFSWGFSSASHFSRAFKNRFGEAPNETRKRALGDAAGGCVIRGLLEDAHAD